MRPVFAPRGQPALRAGVGPVDAEFVEGGTEGVLSVASLDDRRVVGMHQGVDRADRKAGRRLQPQEPAELLGDVGGPIAR